MRRLYCTAYLVALPHVVQRRVAVRGRLWRLFAAWSLTRRCYHVRQFRPAAVLRSSSVGARGRLGVAAGVVKVVRDAVLGRQETGGAVLALRDALHLVQTPASVDASRPPRPARRDDKPSSYLRTKLMLTISEMMHRICYVSSETQW